MEANLTSTVERARRDIEIIGGLQEQVNPMHNKMEKLAEALERARYLHEEGKKDMERIKKKLFQAEQQSSALDHKFCQKVIKRSSKTN